MGGMDADEFWGILEPSRASIRSTDPVTAVEERITALRSALRDLDPQSVRGFQRRVSPRPAG
ncbi:hypothetical protein GCM10023162_34520 [Klenkia terrae]